MKVTSHKNEKVLTESVICREIIQEIMKFGVNQHQIRKIIKLLSLELDDHVVMKSICAAIDGDKKKTDLTF